MSMNPNDEKKPYNRKDAIDAAMANAPARNKGATGLIGDTLLSGLSSAVAVPELAVGLADIATGGRAGKFLENEGGGLGFRPKQAKEAINSWKSEQSQEQMRDFQETEGFGGKLNYARKNPSLISNTVVESLAPMLAGGVVGRGLGAIAPKIAPVAAGALGEGAVGAGLAAEQIRQETDDGLLTGKQAGLAAATGATTAGFGFAGGKIAQKLGIGDVDTLLASGSRTVNGNKGMARRIGEGALTEGLLEELPQSVSETILQNEALGRPLDEGVTDAAVLGLLSGAAMGGVVGGITRNRTPARDDITPTEDMGQEAPRLGLPSPNRPGGNQLGYQGAISDPNNPNWIEDANPDYFNRGQGPNAANMRNLTPDPELTYNSELGGQFSAASDGTVFTESEYNEYLAQQQAQARAARDAGMSDINDITQVPQGYDKYGSDPRLPAPRSDFEVTPDGTAQTAADVNTSIQNERAANAERLARRLRGEIQDNTPVPSDAMGFGDIEPVDNRKLSERMGLDPNKGGLSAAAAIAVDSGASSVAADFEQASAPNQSAWQSGMMDRLANADQNNSTYARLAQAMQNEPASVSEKARLMREADALPRAEVAAKQIKPNTRVLDEARAQTKAYTPEGREVQAQWDVVDASDLVTSNTDSFTINPDFPASRQPRDRTRASAQQQVNEIASKLQPNLLGESPDVSTGAPFVGANDNVVDSGNGRSMAIRRVYQEGGEKAGEYRQFVNEQAAKFGLDTDAVNMMQSPVLVRRNTSDINRDEFARAANKPTAARMSSTEQAASDAKNLPDASLLSFNSEGSMSLHQSQRYLKNFIAALPKTEQGSLMDESGALSREGKSRIEAAIVQDAYNNPRLVSAISEKLDNDTTNVLRAVTDKAPQISQINADIKTGDVYDNTLARDIADATQAYIDLKNTDKNINDYLSQDSLLGDGLTDGAKEILSVLSDNRRSAKAIGEYIQERINAVTGRGNPKQVSMFDDDMETDAPNVLSNEPAPSNTQAATQLTDENPTVNIPSPKQTRPKVESTEPPVRDMPIGEWVDGMNNAIDRNLAKQKAGSAADAPKTATAPEVSNEKGPSSYRLPTKEESYWNLSAPSTERESVLVDAVSQALDEGIIYNKDLNKRVAEILNVPQSVLDVNTRNTENGDFGYDVYRARKKVEANNRDNSNNEARERLKSRLSVGRNIGTIVTDSGKTLRRATIESMDGKSVKIAGTTGSKRLMYGVNYSTLEDAIKRAEDEGKREKFAPPEVATAEPATTPEVIDGKPSKHRSVKDIAQSYDPSASRVSQLEEKLKGVQDVAKLAGVKINTAAKYYQEAYDDAVKMGSINPNKTYVSGRRSATADYSIAAAEAAGAIEFAKNDNVEDRKKRDLEREQADSVRKSKAQEEERKAVEKKESEAAEASLVKDAFDLSLDDIKNLVYRNYNKLESKAKRTKDAQDEKNADRALRKARQDVFDVEDAVVGYAKGDMDADEFLASKAGEISELADAVKPPQAPVTKPETVAAIPVKPPQSSVAKTETAPEIQKPTGDWQTQMNGNEFRINEDGITVRKHDRVVHIHGANSIAANKKAKELAGQDIRELHYIAAKEDANDPFSEGSIWLDGNGDMVRKKGTKKPTGSLLPILKQAETKTAPKKADKPATPTAVVAEIEDFGEKITGARKDMQSFYQKEMTDDDIINQPLSKIWPKKDIDAIEDTQMAALATALRSTIPTKPRKGYRLNSWVNKVKSTRGIMQNMLSSDMPADEFISQLTQIEAVADIGYHAQLLAQLDKEQWSRIDKVDPQIGYQKRNENGDYIPFVGFAVTIDKRTHTFNTEQRDVSEIIDKVDSLLAGEVKTQGLKFDLYSRGRGDTRSWFITQASDKDKTPLIEFNDRDSARAFLKENNSELSDLWEQHKERVNVKKSDMRSNANRERVGPDHRGGLDVTTEQFMTTFGLRGGQFGNWVKQGANSKDRQNMLNDAYDAFMDLAGVLGIPPEAIGLGGKLAMSFGARGKGRAMAHYEPSQVIINLTKTKGAGSLAHEWFHALDNHFTSFRDDPNRLTSKENAYITYKPEPMLIMKDQNGKPSRMRPITETRRKQLYEMNKNRAYLPENFMPDPNHKEGVRPQVEAAFANLVETLDESPMKERAVTIDKGAPDGYWSRIIERAARAFEGYVINKLEKQGARSDFLANVTPEDAFPRNMDRYPYLLQSEMAPVAEAFDNLFATMDSKASEDGNGKTLFSRAAQLNEAIDKVKAGAIGSTQTTRQQVIAKLSDRFGKETVQSLLDNGLLDIKTLSDFVVDGNLTIPNDVDGLYHNGKATLIADNLSDDMIIPTFLHELGGHGGLQTMMSDKAYAALMKDFDAMVKAGDPLAMQAKAMADKVARNEQEALDEYLPYLLTLAARKQGKQGKVAGMINRMAMAIRSWLRDTFGLNLKVNAQDVLALAERMVNEREKAANPNNQQAVPQFSNMNVPAKQLDDVRAKYEGTKDWMKAPNGQPTNLTERQWLQTQTESFKDWFGDSKMVDENDDPLVVYHGTGKNFTEFSKEYFNTTEPRGDYIGQGFYFSPDKETASKYASAQNSAKPNIIPTILSAQNPIVISGDKSRSDLHDMFGGFKEFYTTMRNNPADVQSRLAEMGYDGLIDRDYNQYAVFEPTQIKSATDNAGTFDGNNPDIRFSRAAGMNDQFDPRNIARESATRLYDWASSAPPGKLSWWHKTIGTMYNLAQRNPYFKPVFENTEKFINDVSFYAAKASEMAPRLLPQLDSLRDITKSAIGAKDNEALSKPIFEGTLLWGRDLDGKAVLIEDWRKKVMATSKQDRLQMLKDANRITPAQLQQLATLNNIQANRFINGIIDEEVNAGLVWTDSELRSKFDLSDEQIELYREFRSATDKSLDSLTRSDMLRRLGKDANDIEAAVMEAGTLREAVFNIEQHINSLIQASPKKEKALKETLKDIKESQFRTNKLIDDGYAPLSRFGQYTVDVVDSDGNREYFGMFESAYEARKMKAEMDALYGNNNNYTVTQGALSKEEFKLFAGVTPETAELFGEMLGLDATGDKAADEAFQEYLKRTKNNRSAMKRLMHRKGIKGYSEDVGRVLASFIYSNARHTSAALNMSNIDRAITDIPKGEGQLKDAAVKLAEYIKNPQEEAQLMRGWMFAQYLGGSIASAVVNITQPIAVSFPYLSQFGGAVKAASQLGKASSDWTKAFKDKDRSHFEPDLLAAIERAEADGTLSPQEVHNLLKQASGKNPLSAGDGTKIGDAKALAGNTLSRVSLAWGSLFSGAEQINRRVTFVAAYRMAVEQGMANPAEFATKSIKETQFVYNKASRMNWGRGAVGGTLMTFKTYTVSYIELMHRLWNQGEKGSPERAQGRKATMIMLGVMFMLSGSGGLPFMEDAEDLIDGIGQIMGYNFSTKKARQDFLDAWFGEMLGDFLESGASTLPGSPTDVSGRLGLGNLIPGTGIFKERTNNTRDVLEIAGPAGDFAGRIATGTRDIAKGVANLDATSLKKGALEFSPTAVRNAVKGIDMGASGIYKDTKGYKVTDVSPVDAAFKFAGFQPLKVSKIQEANYLGQTATSYYSLRASNIRALWAAGVVEGNSSKVADAKAAVKDWNEKNPDQKIVIRPTDIARRVREMKMDKSERVTKLAPKSMRAQMAQDFSQVRDGF